MNFCVCSEFSDERRLAGSTPARPRVPELRVLFIEQVVDVEDERDILGQFPRSEQIDDLVRVVVGPLHLAEIALRDLRSPERGDAGAENELVGAADGAEAD